MLARGSALVVSLCSLRRSASPGSCGAGQRFRLAHQVSQDTTAARLRFHVDGARLPHRESGTFWGRLRRERHGIRLPGPGRLPQFVPLSISCDDSTEGNAGRFTASPNPRSAHGGFRAYLGCTPRKTRGRETAAKSCPRGACYATLSVTATSGCGGADNGLRCICIGGLLVL